MKNKLLAILIAVLVLAGSTAAIFAVMQPSAEDILVQSLETTQAITDGHAIIDVNASLPDEEVSGTAEIWAKLNAGPNGEPAVRIEVLAASKAEAGGTVFVADGNTFWLWNPTANTVLTGTAEDIAVLAEEAMAKYEGDFEEFDHEFDKGEYEELADADHPKTSEEAVAKLLEYVDVDKIGTENVDGTSAYHIRFIPKPEQMPDEFRATGGLLEGWFRTEDSAPLAIELVGNSFVEGKASASSLEINQGIDDSVFTFDIPEGAEVINVRDIDLPEKPEVEAVDPDEAGLLVPNSLPEGATLLETVSMAGTAVQQYSLPEGKGFTVSQGAPTDTFTPDKDGETVMINGVEATLFADEDGARTLLTWVANGTQIWIGGDVTPEQAVAIAESLN